MSKAFQAWIAFQLVFIGVGYACIEMDVERGTFNCSSHVSEGTIIAAALFPLAVFVPEPRFLTQYCDARK